MAARLAIALLALLLAPACQTATAAGGGDVAGALITTGIAATAAGISRAQGGCYAACPPGTTCNTATGLCDTLPCRGRCAPTERCEKTGTIERCVDAKAAQMQIDRPAVTNEPLLSPAPPPVP